MSLYDAFEPVLKAGTRAFRRLGDIKGLLYDSAWPGTVPDLDLYYMYNDVALGEGDRRLMIEHSLRFDVTILPPLKLGAEPVKTAGHYHPLVDNTGITYPEIYEVLEGRAHFLLQCGDPGSITDVLFIDAAEGDKVIIPPNYGHVMVNPGPDVLVLSDWVFPGFKSIYDTYVGCGGAAYFELADGRLVPNGNYGELPEIRFLKPTNFAEVGLSKERGMYDLVENLEKLAYLKRPQDYGWLWKHILGN